MDVRVINDARRRGIEYLVHFTNTKNLESILSHGLLNRDYLDNYEYDYEYNDYLRLDNVTESISTSITFPNYKMFWAIRKNNPNEDWAILFINAIKAFQRKCAFCSSNAACNEERLKELEKRCTYEAYVKMFEESGSNTRKIMGLTPDEPTNPQAEVLVLENIPINFIDFCLFENQIIFNKYRKLFHNKTIIAGFDKGYFDARHDYRFW